MRLIIGAGVLVGAAAIVAAGCHGETLTSQNGRCGPTPLLLVSAASLAAPDAGGELASVAGMAVDGSDLYFSVAIGWADPGNLLAEPAVPGALMHVSTYGGSAKQIASGYDFFQTPVVTPMNVIVGEASPPSNTDVGILSVPRAGGAATQLATLTGDVLFTLPVTDGTSVYFTDSAGVETVPLAPAASPATPTRLTSEYPVGLGVFGQRLLMLLASGEVESLPLGSGDAGSEALAGAGPADAVPDTLIDCGAGACWLAGGEIERMDPTGGSPATVASLPGPVAAPSVLLFDGTSFFVLGTSGPYATANAAIARIPQQGGAPVVVATLPPSSAGLAVDDACVYFSTSTGLFSLLKNSVGVVVP